MAAVAGGGEDAGLVEKGKGSRAEADLRLPDDLKAAYADRVDRWAKDAIRRCPLRLTSKVSGHKVHTDGYVQFIVDTILPGCSEPIVALRRFSEFEAFRDSLREGIRKERADGISRWLPSVLGGKQSAAVTEADAAHGVGSGHPMLAVNEQLLVSLGYRPDAPARVRRAAASRAQPRDPLRVRTTVIDRPSRWLVRDLPPKTWRSSTDPSFLKDRSKMLSDWVSEVAGIPFLVYFAAARDFLGLDDAAIAKAEAFAKAAPPVESEADDKGVLGASAGGGSAEMPLPASPTLASPGASTDGSASATSGSSTAGLGASRELPAGESASQGEEATQGVSAGEAVALGKPPGVLGGDVVLGGDGGGPPPTAGGEAGNSEQGTGGGGPEGEETS